jgi:phage terminase large subunit GpA-like protein
MELAVEFTEGERRLLKRQEPLTVSQWAAKHLIVQDGPYRGAKLKPEVTPYLIDIMDAFDSDEVEQVVVCGAPQTGKTLAMYACLGYSIDRRPGTKMLAMPDDRVSARVEVEKLRPLLKGSPLLNSLVSKMVSGHVRLKEGSSIFLSSAQAPAQRASITVRDLFLDEEDLYAAIAGHGDPVSDFLERTRSYFFGRKIMRVSKPVGDAGSSIWRAMTQGSDVTMAYEVPCPKCGVYQFFAESGVEAIQTGSLPPSPSDITRLRLGRYRCSGCGALWDDATRDQAVANGRWQPTVVKEAGEDGIQIYELGENVEKPKRVGFHLPAILSRAVSLSELAARSLEAKASEDQEIKQTQVNGDWARPYVPVTIKATESVILSRRDMGLPARVVPAGAVALTCGIDTQKRGFYYLVLAWMPSYVKYVIDYGWLNTFDDVGKLVFEMAYPVQDAATGEVGSETMDIWRSAIDSGGTMGEGVYSRTEEVYEYVRLNGFDRLFAIKGVGHDQTPAVTWSILDRLPGIQKPILGGLRLYKLDVSKFKSSVMFALLNDGVRRAIKLYGYDPEDADGGGHGELIAHLLAEHQVRKPDGKLVWVQTKPENHYLDCLVMARACGDVSWSPSLHHELLMAGYVDGVYKPPTQSQAPPPEERARTRPKKERAW